MPGLFPRFLRDRLLAALDQWPVVLLTGARQTGKSTLVQDLLQDGHPADYLTLDDLAVLAAAKADPAAFVDRLERAAVIDEVQRAPELFLPIKAAVDRNRRPGRFLLTGSAHPLVVANVADSLAGRMTVLTLWPLSQGEIGGTREVFVDRLFTARLPPVTAPATPRDVVRRALAGGYPEVLARFAGGRARAEWFQAYVRTLLERDVRDLSNIESVVHFPRLLQLLAGRVGHIVNFADLGRLAQIPQTTLKRYTALLQAMFLLDTVPAWSGELGRRAVKHPKLVLNDSGLAAALLGVDEDRMDSEPSRLGPLLENFVVMELRKQLGWSRTAAAIHHFRTHGNQEVDIVLERTDGKLVGIEVKASQTLGPADVAGLNALQAAARAMFHHGVILYMGHTTAPFGSRITALPISSLWQWSA